MRVVAGSAKGVRLAPVPKGVRPVSDVAREGVFSSLAACVPGARVLDLYAGTGAMGIEALSRGAASAVFVERSREAVATIRDNLARTRLGDRAEVVVSPVLRFLTRTDKPEPAFELALIDPPYETTAEELEPAFAAIDMGWLADGWRVVLTRAARSSTFVIPLHWHVARRLEYGDSLVLVFGQG